MREMDRRTAPRLAMPGGFAAGASGMLSGCDYSRSAQAGSPTVGTRPGSLILADSPLVARTGRARFGTGKVRSRTVSLVAGGVVPGPVIRVTKGDTVRATFTNRVAQETAVHWHGVALRNDMDGTLVTQQPIRPGAGFTYEFKASEAGTF